MLEHAQKQVDEWDVPFFPSVGACTKAGGRVGRPLFSLGTIHWGRDRPYERRSNQDTIFFDPDPDPDPDPAMYTAHRQ
jgi:hypothetical protein